jgi:hypothetical protein
MCVCVCVCVYGSGSIFNVLNSSLQDTVFTMFLINLITFFCNLQIVQLPHHPLVYIQSWTEEFTVTPGYNNISLSDILYIVSNIMSHHLIQIIIILLCYNDSHL